jgi:hypothetical protein
MKQKKPTETKSESDIELIFDGDRVISSWYHPELESVLCALCGKNCTDGKCVNINPYCG